MEIVHDRDVYIDLVGMENYRNRAVE